MIGYNPAMNQGTQGNIRNYIGCTAHELYAHRERLDIINAMYDVYRKKGVLRQETFCDYMITDNYRLVDCVSFFVQPDLLIQFIEDVTDRRQAISALKQSEERFKALYMGIPIPVIARRYIGDTFHLIDYNNAMISFTQGSIEGLVGTSADLFFSQYPELANDIRFCYEEQTTLHRETAMKLIMNSEKSYLTFTCAYVPDGLVLMHINDITEQKQAEISLLRYQWHDPTGSTQILS